MLEMNRGRECGKVCGSCFWFNPYKVHFEPLPRNNVVKRKSSFLFWEWESEEYEMNPDTYGFYIGMTKDRINKGLCTFDPKSVEKYTYGSCSKWTNTYIAENSEHGTFRNPKASR